MQSIKQVAVFCASMAEGKVRSPLEAASDAPLAPIGPALGNNNNSQHATTRSDTQLCWHNNYVDLYKITIPNPREHGFDGWME
ncbi:unnamed protein product [Danaus chrysippus]|uniref:(African queen) hypothetical protein n=1 Tax=Danaus chrysippus TaxID=151541 RepID=A0A8J2R4H3_9NEOP|nr:unnamed protein product [Danaus chrysippus]